MMLLGGPASVFSSAAHQLDPAILPLGIPVLGICYGVQLMAFHLGGSVEFSDRREYGACSIKIVGQSDLFQSLPSEFQVWNSHGDKVTALPPGFRPIGETENYPYAALEDTHLRPFRLQFP